MLDFKKIEIDDIDKWDKYTEGSDDISSESSFVNLLVWSEIYQNEIAFDGSTVFIKSRSNDFDTFRLPLGGDLNEGLKKIEEYSGDSTHGFWNADCETLRSLPKQFFEKYDRHSSRDTADYIYLQSDLAELSGKKYHSKRNHISAFGKKHNWQYEPITNENISLVRECADAWYNENSKKLDRYMLCEKNGIELMLQNMERLHIKGGAIVTDGKVVAFTLGSPINKNVFDIHIEKALGDYAEAYAVINREFAAKELADYTYINREDDMGIEGLRKAKLSYKPQMLVEKFYFSPKLPEWQIYREAFGDEREFEDKLFSVCKKHLKTFKKDGKTVSMLFLLPCNIHIGKNTVKADYLFAAATDSKYRNKGYASALIKVALSEGTPIFLRPATEELCSFYEKLGFKKFSAQSLQKDNIFAEPTDEFEELCKSTEPQYGEQFSLMGVFPDSLPENLYFPYSML